MQLIPLLLLTKVESDANINFARLDSKSISRVLGNRNYRFMFLSLGFDILCLFRDIEYCSLSFAGYRTRYHTLHHIDAVPGLPGRCTGIVFQRVDQ